MRALILIFLLLSSPALAFERIESRDAFLSLVQGRTLAGDGVSLRVGADGSIAGRGFGFRVTGGWTWEDGFFCRTLDTLVRDFPRNCQLVQLQGNVLRFTADRGAGDVADLTLR
ncbi:dihydrodipicolinate reductase [Jannaschia formosa]|uniref:dihydrodipicolinate reductase n=1 Tax=Jannaschia formosa TaxID=2259592 RepID=UPI000E1B7258|nr:dihydrodipicolinate reductase [Jannaschia formosa]TFL20071.1 dihydrodipicolinate reductase [Jannaschia formosa]